MMSKYLRLSLFILALLPWNSMLLGQIIININNGMPNETISIVNPNYYFDITPISQTQTSLDGKGVLVHKIDKTGIIVVDIGNRKTLKLLVEPNQEYNIEYTTENILFTGHNYLVNKALYENRKTFNSFRYNNKTFIKWDFGQEFNKGISLLKDSLQSNLNKLSQISEEDSTQLANDLNYKLLGSKISNFLSKNTDFSSVTIWAEYDKMREEIPLDNAYLEFISYNSVLNVYSTLLNNYYFISRMNERDGQLASPQKLSQVEFIINEKFPQKITDYILTDFFLSKISSLEDLPGTYNKFSNHISNHAFKKLIEDRIKANSRPTEFNIYQESYFSSPNKKVLLKDSIPGKLIYMDIWATWCGPCIKEFKYSKELPTQLKDMEDLKFVYASIDIDEDKWTNFIRTKNPPLGTHINLNKEETSILFQELNLNGVPRYIIINREGIIVDEDAPAPSNPKLREVLLKHYK